MTTVERYRSTQLDLPPDVPTNGRRTHTSFNTIARSIPPAVPSPPRQSNRNSPPRKPQAPPRHHSAASMASDDSSQWLFTENELANTPSVLDGLPIAEERCRRAKGVNFIIQAGILLKLPQLTLATASVFFHRFYMRQSMVVENGKMGIHHYNIAATSLFLATKTEENCRKTKEIVIAVAKVAQKNSSLIIDEQSKEYWRWRDSILLLEELMLELLTFDVVLQSPYNFLYQFLQKLQIEDNKPLRNAAWAFLNDSSLTMMCLLIPPKDIAVAAIYFAARYTHTQIADDNGDSWWDQVGGRPEMITRAVGVINEFYSENPLKKSDNPYEHSPSSFGNEEDLDRTRSRNEAFSGGTPQSQRSQNGHHERRGGTGTPVINGSNPDIESRKPASPSAPVAPEASTVPTNGSSDVALKEAANDPATHEVNGHSNGMSELLTTADQPVSKTPPKRKELDGTEETSSKRLKLDSEEAKQQPISAPETAEVPKVNADPDDESEEGELEE